MNLHAEALLHCVLASREDKGHQWIHEILKIVEDPFNPGKSLYSTVGDYIDIGTDVDFGYIMQTPKAIFCAVSGTIGPFLRSKAWLDDCRIFPENGLHRGWNHGAEPFADALKFLIRKKSERRPIKAMGLSRGDPVSEITVLKLREDCSYPDIEHVGWNGPYATNKRGWRRMKAAQVRSTHFYHPSVIRDIVDKVGVIGGRHYGLRIPMPDQSQDIALMDHDYSPTCESMAILMGNWGKPVEADFCASIKRFCKSI